MCDVLKFSNLYEYKIFELVFEMLILSEFFIFVYTGGRNRGEKKENADNGTVWLILFAWIGSTIISPYFRSESFPEGIRKLLLPHAVYYLGIILIIMGMMIRCLAVWTLKQAFKHSVQTTQDQHLIQRGLYSVVRNPAYTGSILSLLGIAFAYRHIIAIICVSVLCLFCYGIRIQTEEIALKSRFQEEFENYCKKTKYRLIPYIY